ncbi:MAG TPA: type II toxin-antitoxin system VapC family toxin [Pyrinomonadaceae bacterium]|jgi:PIN domain nuclease of toxin-antitoxin system|nr:type II toxin-antitoxin system VapC family toxin [Pyrinomonadaceae bacterium]
MIKNVLDASAVLAVLNGERGEKKVVPLLAESAVSTVNLTEVAAKLLEAGMDEKSAQLAVAVLGIGEIVEFTEGLVWEAARLTPLTRQYGLSLGDRACLALAIKLKVPAVTADKEWAKLKLCKVSVIR